MDVIGETFSEELKAAGLLGLRFSWGADGIFYPDVDPPTRVQQEQIAVVLAAHDPTKKREDPKVKRHADIDAATTLDELKVVLKTLL